MKRRENETWQQDEPPFFWPGGSTPCTRPLYLFLLDYSQVFDHFLFVLTLAHRSDEARMKAAEVLAEISEDDTEKLRYKKALRCPT